MSPWIQESLSMRLARIGMVLALLLGLVMGAFQVWLDFDREARALDAEIEQILTVAAYAATPTAQRLDDLTAQQIVAGLLRYPFIRSAELVTDLNTVLAKTERPDQNSRTRWLTQQFTTHLSRYAVTLHAKENPSRQYGSLRIVVDRDVAFRDFFGRAGVILISGILRNLLLALLLFVAFQRLLARPLTDMVNTWSNIDPAHMNGDRLPELPRHRYDELGQLTTCGNAFLDASQAHLQQRKKLESALLTAVEQAQDANQAKSEFLAMVSHEIRTPMNVVIGLTDLLYEQCENPDDTEKLARVQQAGNALLELVDNILDLSRLESGALMLKPAPFNPLAIARETLNLFAQHADEKGVALHLESSDELPEQVMGDGARLRQILIHLVGNGVKFTQQGAVTLRLHPAANQRGGIHLQVIDTGPGIDPHQQARIFEPFTQGDSALTRRHGGSGLGLSITRHLTHLMGGAIQLLSEPDQGSHFHLILPLPAVSEPTPAPTPQPASPMRLLLAEDNADNRMLIQTFLRNTPHDLVMVENGREAVDRYAEDGGFDLVLMDIQMPVLDGYGATRAIRAIQKERNAPRTPVIALTAHALERDREFSLEVGCDEHLTKPIRKRELLEALQRWSDKLAETDTPSSTLQTALPPA
ncbi:ATP-binding protein [Magnetofaba australis]|uniref:histidine kinase n=1 Tax=Magnetofaba australis IT-1 TaxID=1434232 RepID=A0A1Y2K8R3_9PROT|nr:ATP-binding protein [Magnetofaba australis]OSM07072.1 putative Sensory/regulatory protein RpfC [Magnetofaba australis IT-1]